MMPTSGLVRLYDDFERRVRTFEPLHPGRVNMYVCGVTVYGPCHIGHARAYICFDAVRRYLEYRGYAVNYIQNFTDVDDKIINKAAEEGVSINVISERYVAEYFRDMDALNIKRATNYPRATEYIDQMITMIQGLLDKGFAYESSGNVFFDVRKFPRYGMLSKRNLEDERMIQEPAPGKRDPADFALWKIAQSGEPGWNSPWGSGRPGWHIECSAMSLEIAGGTLDIHGGGEDLTFPHHENEIAQSEAYTGEPFVRYWMHNAFVNVDKEKMSKSIGNVINVRDILEKHSPGALRLLFLGAHYRAPVQFNDERLDESEKALERFRTFRDAVRRVSAKAGGAAPAGRLALSVDELNLAVESAIRDFSAAMDDDFNTPNALAQIFTVVRKANSLIREFESADPASVPEAAVQAVSSAWDMISELAGVLGLDLDNMAAPAAAASADVDALMNILINARNKARDAKQWDIADFIRNALKAAGYVIEDRPEGTGWHKD